MVNFEGTIGERHAENKLIASHESFDSIHENIVTFVNLIHSDKALFNVFREIALRLQGLDVFWNGSCAYVEKIDAKLKNNAKANANSHQLQPGASVAASSMASIHQTQNKSVTKFAQLTIVPFPMCIKLVFDEGHKAILRYGMYFIITCFVCAVYKLFVCVFFVFQQFFTIRGKSKEPWL